MSTIHIHIHNNSLLKSSTVFTQSMNIREKQNSATTVEYIKNIFHL